MGESLVRHLSSLPRPQLARIATAVLGTKLNGSTDAAIHAIARHLLDPAWLALTLERLGPDALAALAAVARAGMPVLRRDVSALASGHGVDPVDALEEHGLLTPVRTGRGMPTHIALPPELSAIVQGRLHAEENGQAGRGPEFAGSRRRFELALMLAAVGQHPPRLTRLGRLHAADLARLADHLAPLGLHAEAIEERLGRWMDLGVASAQDGAVRLASWSFDDVPRLHLALALAQLAAPSIPETTLRIVARLVATEGSLGLRTTIDSAQSSLLRGRAEEAIASPRGARSELVEVIRMLLSLDAVVLQDEAGVPIVATDLAQLSTGERSPMLALEPSVAAALRGEPRPSPAFVPGHVQSSFEVVADGGCDPTLVARIALWARLVRADRAAVLKLERASIAQARRLGYRLPDLLIALAALGGTPVPGNVVTVLTDWFSGAEPAETIPVEGAPPDLARLTMEARAAVLPETG